MLVLHFGFAFRYTVPDRYSFFFPFYCLSAILIGLGADVVLSRYNSRRIAWMLLVFSFLPILVYFFTPEIGRVYYKGLSERRQIPYRDDYKYFLQPWKNGYNGAERFARETLEGVEKNAVIYADSTTVQTLLYQQEVKGVRNDVTIVSESDHSIGAAQLDKDNVDEVMKNGPLYVVSAVKTYCPGFLFDNYVFAKDGLIYRVIGKKGESK
jgi:hypothetical protein